MTCKSYDLVIVGAGIHGAGVAQAAAVKGYSVLVLEKQDIAYGTSSRSSKLIHGGLRYLETGQFFLVSECLRERDILLKIAPKLVSLEPFHFPVYKHSRRPAWQLYIGLSLYAGLGRFRHTSRFRRIDLSHWDNPDGLKNQQLSALFQYRDAVTDDAVLTRAVMRSATQNSAHLLTHATFTGANLTHQGCWDITYRLDARSHPCRAKVLVNAAGPWINEVMAKIHPALHGLPIDLVQGSHIILKNYHCQGNYYLESPIDERVVFVIPKGEWLMVGTTESAFHGKPDTVQALDAEIDYLLESLKFYFPAYQQYKTAQLQRVFAGLRVLPHDATRAFRRSRDTKLWCDQDAKPSLIAIYGGKLTAYRATAAKVLSKLYRSLPAAKNPAADTRKIML